MCDYATLAPVDEKRVVALRHSLEYPNEIFIVDKKSDKQLTNVNTDLLNQLSPVTVEKVMVPTTDGKEMLTWVVLPPNFDPNKKYPALLYCQGGPQQAVSQFWSYRWNFRLMASQGYIVIAPNRRGLPGFGTEWNAQISGDYGGQNMKDYLSAVDYVKQRPYVDATISAPQAQVMADSPFIGLPDITTTVSPRSLPMPVFSTLSHNILKLKRCGLQIGILGGAFWDKNNAVAQRTYANSPHKAVDKWTLQS